MERRPEGGTWCLHPGPRLPPASAPAPSPDPSRFLGSTWGLGTIQTGGTIPEKSRKLKRSVVHMAKESGFCHPSGSPNRVRA